MHIISTKYTNIHLGKGQKIFGLVTLDTEDGPMHVECEIVPKSQRDIADPRPALLEEAKRKVRRQGKQPERVYSLTVHEMLMSRVA
jgi:hypothetical protein